MRRTRYPQALGGLLSDAREWRRVERAEVAAALGVTRSAVSRWEAGTSCPQMDLDALARAYRLDPQEAAALGWMVQEEVGDGAEPR